MLSCSKDDPSISSAHNRPEPLSRSTSPSAPDLFVVGWIQLTSGVKAASCKNGLITELAETTNPVQSRAGATSIFVSGSDVYVGGMGFNGVHDYAMYWKNGEAVNLTDGIEDAWVNSIFVSGTDVYVAGVVVTSGHSTAVYWKNGVATSLPDGSTAHDIVVWGTDVYVAGMTSTWNPLGPAGYWKNGVFTRLVNGIASNTIVISGSDVYSSVFSSHSMASSWASR